MVLFARHELSRPVYVALAQRKEVGCAEGAARQCPQALAGYLGRLQRTFQRIFGVGCIAWQAGALGLSVCYDMHSPSARVYVLNR